MCIFPHLRCNFRSQCSKNWTLASLKVGWPWSVYCISSITKCNSCGFCEACRLVARWEQALAGLAAPMSKNDENPALDVFDSQKHSRPQTSAQPWQLQHDREIKPTKSDCAFLRDRIVNHSAYKLLREGASSVSDCAMLNLGCILWVFFSSASAIIARSWACSQFTAPLPSRWGFASLTAFGSHGEWRSHWLCEKTRMVVVNALPSAWKKRWNYLHMRASLVSLLYSALVWPL